MNKVQVVPSKEGEVVSVTGNPEYGFVRLQQEAVVFRDKWADIKTRRCIMVAKIDVLDRLFPEGGVPTELTGRIVVKETITPLNAANTKQGLKVAGDTGIVCRDEQGNAIYRDTFYTENADIQDVLIAHANQEEIKAAQLAVTKANSNAIKGARGKGGVGK